ncbi:zinc ribbon domain-containing protein [Chromobacterium sp. IIBBL 290-4]|uniref:zinc ribbon domain-containing protein n=1 Tax=Chromobacterium sp. IIBBL 290-4 TaxID=2953890 RepID=UPI0020B66674|nr:zinc ribbon domain-containing protein [Chromobacterium sp. IIBBL 290-4]UTH75844.1 zinc ribbon domain-containing protein [Chromobacterium sp. IIBBL 290-4]
MQQNQALSRPEKLVRLASWLVALALAGFLVGLGELVIRDLFYLPAGGPPQQEIFQQRQSLPALRGQADALQRQADALRQRQEQLAQARVQLENRYQTQRKGLANWLASREATADPAQSAEIAKRNRELDGLQHQIQQAQQREDGANAQQLDLQQQSQALQQRVGQAETQASQAYQSAFDHYELVVFGWRLALVLPLLLIAVWLFLRYRAHRYWFFVYGYGLFALFAFFVELLPYLPSFGGYVRFLVGIALTVFAGLKMIQAFQRYAERKREELLQSQSERARGVAYAKALQSFQKRCCPSCDHQYNIAGDDADYCIHCGLQLFRVCACGARNFAFFPFCKKCGAAVAQPAVLPDRPASKPE